MVLSGLFLLSTLLLSIMFFLPDVGVCSSLSSCLFTNYLGFSLNFNFLLPFASTDDPTESAVPCLSTDSC